MKQIIKQRANYERGLLNKVTVEPPVTQESINEAKKNLDSIENFALKYLNTEKFKEFSSLLQGCKKLGITEEAIKDISDKTVIDAANKKSEELQSGFKLRHKDIDLNTEEGKKAQTSATSWFSVEIQSVEDYKQALLKELKKDKKSSTKPGNKFTNLFNRSV